MQPTAQEAAAVNEPHVQPTVMQIQHESAARANPQLSAARNQGHPPIAATTHPGDFTGPGVTAAKPVGAAWHPATPPDAVNAGAHAAATNPTHGGTYPTHAPAATSAAAPGHALAATNPAHPVQHAAAPGNRQQQVKPKPAAKATPKKGEPRPEGERPAQEQRG
jgi:hypothetical protein